MKKLLIFISLLIAFGFSSVKAKAQVNWDYTVTQDSMIGWIDMSDAPYDNSGGSSSYWYFNYSDYNFNFGDNFQFYSNLGTQYFYFTSEGTLCLDHYTYYGYPGTTLPSNSYYYQNLIQYGGNTNGSISSIYIKEWQLQTGQNVLTFKCHYNTGAGIEADIEIHLIEGYDYIEINYKNVSGSSTTVTNCGLNDGDGVHYTLIPTTSGAFPDSDAVYLFKPSYTDDLKMEDLSFSGPSVACELDTLYATAKIVNKGVNSQSNFDVLLYSDSTLLETYTVAGPLAQFDTFEVNFTSPIFIVNDFKNFIAVIDTTDEYDNNTAEKTVMDYLTATVDSSLACYGEQAILNANGGDYYDWAFADYPDIVIYSGQNPFVSQNNIYETTNYLVNAKSNDNYVTSVQEDFTFVDHDNYSGDDRGGIAVTPDYFYIVGDDYTVRMTPELTGMISLPMRDGIFSDLSTGTLYTLYNTVLQTDINYDTCTFPFTVDAIAVMDEDLNITDSIIMLSTPFTIGTDNDEGGVFAGKGIVMVKNGEDSTLIKIDIATGQTDTVGVYGELQDNWNTENWAMWGFIETVNGEPKSILFGSENDYYGLQRVDLTTGLKSKVIEFDDNLNYYPDDLHEVAYSPWENKIYYHSETDNEDGGYFDATFGLSGDCWTDVTVNVVPQANAGYGFNGYVCSDDNNVDLMNFLTGSPDTGGTFLDIDTTGAVTNNIFDATMVSNGSYHFAYVVAATDPCSTDDTTYFSLFVRSCVDINEISNSEFGVYPNPTTGKVFISLIDSEYKNLSVEVLNVKGQVVYKTILNSNELNLYGLAAGVYTIRIVDGKNTYLKKIIIE